MNPIGPSRLTRWIIGILVGAFFAIPLLSTLLYTLRDPNGGLSFVNWARLLDPAGEQVVANTPEHLASARAVAPIVANLLQLATRLTLEAPRPLRSTSVASEQEFSPWAVVADVVASGRVERFGIRYSVGVYNVFDWKYSLPVNEVYSFRFLPQQGRTFLLNVGAGF